MSETMGQMPRYQSHKKVWALKIAGAGPMNDEGAVVLTFEDERFLPRELDPETAKRFKFGEGDDVDYGYFVQYEDGYISWSPTKAFEDGYTLIE